MRNAGLDEAQAGIKISRRNINNLRYTDYTILFFFFLDTILMAESKEEQKEPLDVQGADLNVQASNGPKREQRVSLCPATPSC